MIDDHANEISGDPFTYSPHKNRLSHCPLDESLQKSTVAPIPLCGDTEIPSSPQDIRDPVSIDKAPNITDQPIPPGIRLNSKELYRQEKGDPWGD